jgi:hypothetical protein
MPAGVPVEMISPGSSVYGRNEGDEVGRRFPGSTAWSR